MDLRKTGWGEGVEWIQLAQDRDRWRAPVDTVMNVRVLAPRSLLVSYLHLQRFSYTSFIQPLVR
jgi:hypothetical protein